MMLFLPSEGRERYEETYMLAMLAGFGYVCGASRYMDRYIRRGWVDPSEYSNDAGTITDSGLAELASRGRR